MAVLKAIGPPGSIPFIAFCLLLALIAAYVWPRSKRLARNWLWFVVIAHTAMALPLVANLIAGALPRVAVAQAGALQNLDTLFVLDGDNRVGRVRAGAEAARASPNARVHVVGGHWWLPDALVEAGIARTRITHDYAPEDTRQQMDEIERLLASQPDGRKAVVASRLQMPRVAGLVRAGGLHLALIASPIDTEPPTTGWRLLVPSYYALRVSRDAIYEHAALAYYDWRGWIQIEASEQRAEARDSDA
ncbi:MAG TPA: ElyC/SanA/YdcF family protein [Vicinamibacterales bacterium]|nr:ElyC/SanA/YdcF family protein [Vicinamibacterales bacterium]